jgi:hypothetical protein
MKDIFDKNTDDFRRLLAMSEQDRDFQRIDFKFTTLDNGAAWTPGVGGFSEERWEQYRNLFRKLNLKAGIGRQSGATPTVFFYAQCDGTAITQECKGYAYSEGSLEPTKDNLNRVYPGVVFKPLVKNWYLFRDGG